MMPDILGYGVRERAPYIGSSATNSIGKDDLFRDAE